MNISTQTDNDRLSINVFVVDPNYRLSPLIEKMIANKDLDASKAGNTHLYLREEEDTLLKTLYVTSGDTNDFNTSTGNIDKVAKAIVDFMKLENNKYVTIHTACAAIDTCGTDSLCTALVTAAYEFSIEPKDDYLNVRFMCDRDDEEMVAECISDGKSIGDAINTTKYLGDLPSNICTPEFLAKHAQNLADNSHLEYSGFGESGAKDLGMGGLLSVSVGSDEEGRVIILEYNGGNDSDKPTVLVGKAVTFDSGGISIKPSASMEEMKYDMCGGATVIGVMQAASSLGLPINLVGIIGAVENMPSGKATKPGDVITMMSEKTVEVTNTDAEGRMVLADLLTYVGEKYDAATVIDFATLTGAVCVALGDHAAGVFSENDELAEKLCSAGKSVNDKAWRLPIWDEYFKQMDSKFADIGNTGKEGGGASTAAAFLNSFAAEYDYKYAHVDIAGVAWKATATGRPVKMVLEYLRTC